MKTSALGEKQDKHTFLHWIIIHLTPKPPNPKGKPTFNLAS
jgi:hypothetical protein